MSISTLTVVCPGSVSGTRFALTLEAALAGYSAQVLTTLSPDMPLNGHRVLFAIPLDMFGVNSEVDTLLRVLRGSLHFLDGSVGGILVDGTGDLYTKSTARELVLAASQAGCLFVGRPLVEATGNLQNFAVQARNAGCSLDDAYRLAAGDLVRRILTFSVVRHQRPKLTVLHASNYRTSNTMALWGQVRGHLEDSCEITEIGLRNGTLEDCSGCPYTMCLHFGEKGDCFYGGVMVQDVYPSIREANAVLFLCPNYNDALSANLTACINRLTALYRTTPFTDKAVFGIIVSGYSGSDIVAQQLISALCMNKAFFLPPRFCMMETANDAGTVLKLPDIDGRIASFAAGILKQLCEQKDSN